MTEQEIFDKVWHHFVTEENPRSFVETANGGTCRFRQDLTATCPVRCAVGLFIPDDVYEPAMDDGCGSAYDLIELHELPPEIEGLFEEHATLFRELQSTHDSSEHPTDLRTGLRNIALRYGFTVPTAEPQ